MHNEVDPHDYAAEASVIASLLYKTSAFVDAVEGLEAEHFFDDWNQHIYGWISRRIAESKLVNVDLLLAWLEKQDALTDDMKKHIVGSAGLIHCVADFPDEVTAFAHIIITCAQKRRIRMAVDQVLSDLKTMQVEEACDLLHGAISSVFDTGVSNDLVLTEDCLDDDPAEEFVKTGFSQVDRRCGGLEVGGVTVLAGRPGMGKSAIAVQIAAAAARAGETVLYFSLEVPRQDILNRMACTMMHAEEPMSRVPFYSTFKTGEAQASDWRRRREVLSTDDANRVIVDDKGGIGPDHIRRQFRKARRLARQRGWKEPRVIVVDHLGKMAAGRRTNSQYETVTAVSDALLQTAKEFNIAVLALSQLNRAVEQRQSHKPQLADLRESGAIEQDASVVLLAYRQDYYLQRSIDEAIAEENAERAEMLLKVLEQVQYQFELDVAKARSGRPGTVRMQHRIAENYFQETTL